MTIYGLEEPRVTGDEGEDDDSEEDEEDDLGHEGEPEPDVYPEDAGKIITFKPVQRGESKSKHNIIAGERLIYFLQNGAKMLKIRSEICKIVFFSNYTFLQKTFLDKSF